MPGHSHIPGNEEADIEARAALHLLPPRQMQPFNISMAYLRRLSHQRRQDLVDQWWSTACPPRYLDLDLQMRRRKPPELGLSRRLLHGLIAARTGHGDFASYHRRFKHEDASMECACGKETSPTHFIRCRNHNTQVRKLRKGATFNTYIKLLLGPKGLDSFKEFVKVTGYFSSQSINFSSAGSEESNHNLL